MPKALLKISILLLSLNLTSCTIYYVGVTKNIYIEGRGNTANQTAELKENKLDASPKNDIKPDISIPLIP